MPRRSLFSHPVAAAIILLVMLVSARPSSVDSASTTVYARYADSSCASTPKQVAFNVSSSTCTASSSSCSLSGSSGNSYYVKQSCLSSATDDAVVTATEAFFVGSASPYVLMEVYQTASSCGASALVSAVAFLADGKCLVSDNGDSSVKASVNADGSALLVTYSGAPCTGVALKSNAIASASAAGKACVNDAFKFYTSSVATPSSASESATTVSTTSASSPSASSSALSVTVVMTILMAALAAI